MWTAKSAAHRPGCCDTYCGTCGTKLSGSHARGLRVRGRCDEPPAPLMPGTGGKLCRALTAASLRKARPLDTVCTRQEGPSFSPWRNTPANNTCALFAAPVFRNTRTRLCPLGLTPGVEDGGFGGTRGSNTPQPFCAAASLSRTRFLTEEIFSGSGHTPEQPFLPAALARSS